MSGFVGYILNTETEVKQDEMDRLTKMVNLVSHRGPDDEGFYMDEYVRIGFRQLGMRDSGIDQQPFFDGRYWIVFDGAIYNYLELREGLESIGYVFHTTSVIEVLIALYDDRQESVLNDLRGMFSFIIWDKQEKKLFGARDPFGIKPFYMMEDNEGLYCASEMKSLQLLINEQLDERLNLKALQHYFSFQYVPEPQTIQKGIYKLEPGYYFCKRPGENIQIRPYWKPFFLPQNHSYNVYVAKIKKSLRESVSLHMRSKVPVGALLSGGLDSSAIVALAKDINPRIKTFTVGFEREGYSEIEVAKHTAEQLAVENFHHVITPKEFIEELPNVIRFMDDPVADPAAISLYIIAKEAKQHVKIILSGEGADELFGGYNIYREPGDLQIFKKVPKSLQSILKSLARHLPEGIRGKSFLERGTSSLEDRFIGNAKLFSEKEKILLLKRYHSNYTYKQVTQPLYDNVQHYLDVHKMQHIDLHTWIRGDILIKADRMTMAHSLELRTPFLDREVFKIASELHPEQTIAKGTTKYALREAMKDIVPDSVRYNKKLGFPVPIRHWLQNELYDWAKAIIENSSTENLIEKSYVLHILEVHQLGQIDYSRKIWSVLVFMIWYEIVFENNH